MGFRDYAEYGPVENRGATVIKLAAIGKRQAEQRKHFLATAVAHNLAKRGFRSGDQCVLQKEVAAGIPGHGELRKGQNAGAGPRGFVHQVHDARRVVGTVRDPDIGPTDRYFDKSMFQ